MDSRSRVLGRPQVRWGQYADVVSSVAAVFAPYSMPEDQIALVRNSSLNLGEKNLNLCETQRRHV